MSERESSKVANRRSRKEPAPAGQQSLGSGTNEAAAGLHGSAAIAAERTFISVIAGDWQVEQRTGFHGKLDFAAATIDERAGRDNSSPGFFHYLNGLEGRL